MTRDVLGVTIEVGVSDFEVRSPLVDRPLSGGLGHVIADRSRAILSVTGVGTFAVESGVRIRFQPEGEIPAGAAAVWLHGTVTALLLAQRGQFALHASTVEIDSMGLALSGFQQCGKSTTALRLAQLGHSLVTDDVSPVELDDPILVRSSTRPIHVHPETADVLRLDLSGAQPIMAEHRKLALSLAPHDPVPLVAVVVLELSKSDVPVAVTRLRGSEAPWLVGQHTYRAGLLRELWQAAMFVWACEIADRVPVYRITRPSRGWTVDAVADAVERIAFSGSQTCP